MFEWLMCCCVCVGVDSQKDFDRRDIEEGKGTPSLPWEKLP